MFIDSPGFSHRRILNDPRNDTHTRKKPDLPYQYGVERNQLARHVTKSLNSHESDFEILEKFRRQAEEDKRKKWLAKRAPTPREEPDEPPPRRERPFIE